MTRDHTHDELRALVSAHALDALDADDAATVRAHLTTCPECRAAFDDALEAAAMLALAAPAAQPSADLRERILAAARAEPSPPLSIDAARTRRASRELVPARVVAALCAVAAAVAVMVAISARRDESRLRSQLSALSSVARPGSQVVYLKRGQADAGVAVVVGRGGKPVLVSTLGQAPAGRVYQVWAIPPGSNAVPISAGLLRGGGDILLRLSGPLPAGTTIAITIEPGGGSKAPTSTPIMAGAVS